MPVLRSLRQMSELPERFERKISVWPSADTDGRESSVAPEVRRCGAPVALPSLAATGRLQIPDVCWRLANATRPLAIEGWSSCTLPVVSRSAGPLTWKLWGEIERRHKLALSPSTAANRM